MKKEYLLRSLLANEPHITAESYRKFCLTKLTAECNYTTTILEGFAKEFSIIRYIFTSSDSTPELDRYDLLFFFICNEMEPEQIISFTRHYQNKGIEVYIEIDQWLKGEDKEHCHFIDFLDGSKPKTDSIRPPDASKLKTSSHTVYI